MCEYMNDNKKTIKQKKTDDPNYQKNYRLEHKERIQNAKKEYRLQNANHITCDICGSTYINYNKSHHMKSKKHNYSVIKKENFELKQQLHPNNEE